MNFLVPLLALAPGNLPDNVRDVPVRQVRALIAGYGDCIVKREPERASAAILAGLGSNEMLDRYPRLMQDSCVPTQLGDRIEVTFRGNQYIYAIADALVTRDFASLPAPVLHDLPPINAAVPAEPPRVDAAGRPLSGRALEQAVRASERLKAANYMWRYGECVVRVDPAATRALLLTEPGSAQEDAQLKAMGTPLGTCLGEGRTLEFGKVDLRGTLAVNYYRLASAARQRSARGAIL